MVGSACPAACSIWTEGPALSKYTELSVEVEAALALPAASLATPAARLATTFPAPLMPVTATL